uniref:Uncharacterized protein n=1 Tax=Onchocerca volvulus TaxID=6282 RepID=A0A8R1XM30_ONCVO
MEQVKVEKMEKIKVEQGQVVRHSFKGKFQDNFACPSDLEISGDVKYHLGYSSDRTFANGRKIHLSLCPNPSYLKAVNPVLATNIFTTKTLQFTDKQQRSTQQHQQQQIRVPRVPVRQFKATQQ